MQKDGRDGKATKGSGYSPATGNGETLKQPWQTPEIIEEDYRKTESTSVPGTPSADGFGYS